MADILAREVYATPKTVACRADSGVIRLGDASKWTGVSRSRRNGCLVFSGDIVSEPERT